MPRFSLHDLKAKYQEQAAPQIWKSPHHKAQSVSVGVSVYRRDKNLLQPGNDCERSGVLKHVLPWPPSANAYWRSIVIRGAVRVLVSGEARKYKERVASLIPANPANGHLSVTMAFYRPRRIGDLDNSIKVTLDALKGILFHDDKQIVEIRATRHDDKDNPRVEIHLNSGIDPYQ